MLVLVIVDPLSMGSKNIYSPIDRIRQVVC
jgi:hypothetical protein